MRTKHKPMVSIGIIGLCNFLIRVCSCHYAPYVTCTDLVTVGDEAFLRGMARKGTD